MRFRYWKRALFSTVLSASLLSCGGAGGTGRVSIVLSSTGAPTAAAVAPASPTVEPRDDDHACPAPQAASVTFSGIVARTLDGALVDVTIDLPVTVDLLSLVNGKQATLPAGFLPAGTYDQLVLVIRQLDLTLATGTKVTVTPPGGGWTAVVPLVPPIDVVAGQTTTVPLTFRGDLSFRCVLGDWDFDPAFEHDDDHGEHD